MAKIPALRCEGHRRKSGAPCQKPALLGRRFCAIHGGTKPIGPANSSWKGGKYSKYLPAKLLDTYERSLKDPDLLGLRHEIASVDARLLELFGSLQEGGGSGIFKALRTAQRAFNRANDRDDRDARADAFAQMMRLVGEGSTLAETWAEIYAAQDHRRKLVDTERKRLADMKATITAEAAVAFAAAVVQIVRKYVTDPPTLSAMTNEIAILMNRTEPRELLPGRPGAPAPALDEDDDGE